MVAALIPGRMDLRAVMARGSFLVRMKGNIWFRESIRMENAVLRRVFHMNNAEKTAKRIGNRISQYRIMINYLDIGTDNYRNINDIALKFRSFMRKYLEL